MAAKGGKGKVRGHGEGAVYYSEERKRWLGMVELPAGPSGQRRRRKVSGKTRAEVLDKLRTVREDTSTPEARSLTVGGLMTAFLEHGLPSTCRSEITRDNYRRAAESITTVCGSRKIRDLTASDVEKVLRELAEGGAARSSLVHVRGVFRRALRWAMRDGLAERNVAELADLPAGAGRRVSKSLTKEQALALRAAARNDRVEALILLALNVPVRPGELTGLCWDDLDLNDGVVRFQQALHAEMVDGGGRRLVLGELKTASSRRVVGLPEVAVTALRAHRARQAAEKLAAGPVWQGFGSEHGGLVFATEVGGPIDPANLRRSLRQLTRKAGIEGHWTTYELRHTSVSLLSEQGVPLEDIADMAGHKDSTTTARVYRHQIRPVLRSGAAVMDRVFGAVADR